MITGGLYPSDAGSIDGLWRFTEISGESDGYVNITVLPPDILIPYDILV